MERDFSSSYCPHKRIMQHHIPVNNCVVTLTGTLNNPSYPQAHTQIELLAGGYMEEQGWVPASSTSLHLNLKQVDELIADLEEQRKRMIPWAVKGEG